MFSRTKDYLRALRRSRQGNAIVEMALMLPVLMAICAGVVDFSRVMFYSVQVANAAQAGAQWACQSVGNSGNTAMISTVARDDAGLGTQMEVNSSRTCACSNGATVSCTASGGSCSDGKLPKVTVSVITRFAMPTFLPIPGVDGPVVINGAAAYRVQ